VIDRPILPLEKQKTGKLKGLIVGGFIAIFLTILSISIKEIFRVIML
jgi:hypothetical protein